MVLTCLFKTVKKTSQSCHAKILVEVGYASHAMT